MSKENQEKVREKTKQVEAAQTHLESQVGGMTLEELEKIDPKRQG